LIQTKRDLKVGVRSQAARSIEKETRRSAKKKREKKKAVAGEGIILKLVGGT